MTEQKRIEQLEQKVENLEKVIEELRNQIPDILESFYQEKINQSLGR